MDDGWISGSFAKENSKYSHLGVNLSVRLNVIWCSENSNNQLHPVGSGKERAGIYDACGLVYEFCKMKITILCMAVTIELRILTVLN